MASRGIRLARGWSGAAAATLAAALSHSVAGGGIPSLSVIVLSLALSGLVCTLLAGRVLSLWRLAAAVALSQAVFHWLFSAGTASSTMAAPRAQMGHAGHLMDTRELDAVTAMVPTVMDHDSALMWLGHALAAVATIAVLRHGEVAAVRLLQALRLRLVRLIPLFAPVPVESGPQIRPDSWPVRALLSFGVPLLSMRHRGPPRPFPVS